MEKTVTSDRVHALRKALLLFAANEFKSDEAMSPADMSLAFIQASAASVVSMGDKEDLPFDVEWATRNFLMAMEQYGKATGSDLRLVLVESLKGGKH